MKPDDIQAHYKAKSRSDLARKLGKPISTVHDWFQRGVVPRAVQLEQQIATRGKLKAEGRQ